MTQDLANLYIKIDSDGVVTADKRLDKLTGSSKTTEKATDSLASSFDKLGKQLNTYAKYALAASTALAIYQIQKQTRIAIGLASELQEVQGKFDVVFAGQRAEAEKWGKTLVGSYAMSTIEAKKYLSSVQDLLVPMGMSSVSAGKLSNEIVKLAADLGSFNDLPTEQVMLNIQSALTGEYQVMRKYGVVLNATIVQQKAMTMGMADTVDELTAGQKAQAAYALMVEGSTAALGDMERTMDSAANQEKQQKALLTDISTLLGQAILPYYQEMITQSNNWLLSNKSLIDQNIPHYIEKIADAIVFTVNVMRFFENAWLGIKLVGTLAIQGIAIALDEMFNLLRIISKPLDAIFDGLVKIKALDFNPFDAVESSLETFRLSSGDVTKDVLADIRKTNDAYDNFIEKIKEFKEALITAPTGIGQDNGDLPSLLDSGPSLFVDPKEAEDAAQKEAEAIIKAKIDMYEDLKAYENEYREANLEWIEIERQARIDAGLDEAAANIKARQQIADFDKAVFDAKREQTDATLSQMGSAFQSIGSMYEQGSGSYKKMQQAAQAMVITQNALAAVEAVNAVLNQAQGDPYSAPFRMAAMIGTVATLLGSIGLAFGGGGSSSGSSYTEASMTGDSGSESVGNAYEILEDTYNMELRELSNLNESMINLNSNISGLAADVIKYDVGIFTNMLAEIRTYSLVGEVLAAYAQYGLSIGGAGVGSLSSGGGIDSSALLTSSGITIEEELSESTKDSISSVYQDISDTLIDLTSQFGTDLTSTLAYTFESEFIDITGKTAEEIDSAFVSFFSGLGDTAVSELFGSIVEGYQQIGEGLYETAIRLVTDKAIIVDMLEKSGQAFTGTIPEIIEFSETIIAMADGIDNLRDSFDIFYTEFIPEAERFTNLQADLSGALSDINTLLPDTRDGYRDLVQGLDLSTEAGQQAYVALLTLSEQAASYYSGLEDLESEAKDLIEDRLSLELELLKAQGESEQALALARQYELDAMDESLRSIQEQIWAQEDLNDAMETYTSITEALSSAIDDISGNATVSTQAGFNTLYTQAMGGDTEALTALPAAAKTFLASAYSMSQTELDYRRTESQVLNQLAQAASFSTSQGEMLAASIPGHATGLNNVPYDGYLMKAHKNEAVLTAPQAEEWRKSKSGNVTSLNEFKELKNELRGLREVTESGNYQLAKNTLKISKILGRFDDDGMPAERLV